MSDSRVGLKQTLAGPTAKRLVACLFGAFVLALMVGDQEGSQTDFGISFQDATSEPRLGVFLAVGVVVFLAITYSRLIVPYVRRPGAMATGVGFLAVLTSFFLLNWFDPVGKFSSLADEVGKTDGISSLATAYFGWLAYTLWIAGLALGLLVLVVGRKELGYLLALLGIVGAVISFLAHAQVVSYVASVGQNSTDHALGVYAAVIGFAVYVLAGLVMARSQAEVADPQGFGERVLAWRPGFPLAVIACLLLIVAFFSATWFAPSNSDLDFAQTRSGFAGTGLDPLADTYLHWAAITIAAVTAVLALVGCYLRSRVLGLLTLVFGLVGLFLTFYSLEKMSRTGSDEVPQFGKLWQNLGNGGWVVCIAFGLLAGAGALCVPWRRRARPATDAGIAGLPVHAAVTKAGQSSLARAIIPIAIVMALFYPPTLTDTWQNVLVTQIGVYVLLAVGLNVVIGWSGLLDLGYIAFYGIGSYTTAYITGSLPLKPPSFLHLSPLWAIPFAIAACLVAGVLLGAPTLRLRGDYLAIVTLGFGEIIQIVAINNPFGLTGGPIGPSVPNPVLNLGIFHVHWGLDNLPYWYLLLVLIVIMVIFFFRLENSRIGRAWAAIREDEVAAQATGINTTRAKLLAFSIGASTSGLAGVFFASQVGYFDPTEFTLQNSILIVAYVVFGGMGSLPGTIAGAAVLTWLPQFLKSQVPLADRQMWIGVIILLMMIFRPAGLIPARRRAAELHGLDSPASAETRAVPAAEGL